MLFALGELARAEDMARRSLSSWRGVPHTEALSHLVLGNVLTSAGRHDEARAALQWALNSGREQQSALFEGEALVRRARLWQQCGRWQQALEDLDAAELLLRSSSDPQRVSQYEVLRATVDAALHRPPQPAGADRLRAISLRSSHPLLHARLARVEAVLALRADQPQRALQAAQRGADIARGAGLLEVLAEALLMAAHAGQACGQDAQLTETQLQEVAALAHAQGFADCGWRAQRSLLQLLHSPAQARAERDARRRLQGAGKPSLFDEKAALLRPG